MPLLDFILLIYIGSHDLLHGFHVYFLLFELCRLFLMLHFYSSTSSGKGAFKYYIIVFWGGGSGTDSNDEIILE